MNGSLLVGGTEGDDRIAFKRKHGETVVDLNGERLGPFTIEPDARLIAFGQDGDDRISSSLLLRHDVEFHGGLGNDHLFGSTGSDLLVGGPGRQIDCGDSLDITSCSAGSGSDNLWAGLNRSLLIGGSDADQLFGSLGQDLLIDGTTQYDDTPLALREILTDWASPGSYSDRVALLRDSSRPFYLQENVTVFHDAASDHLLGGFGQDWYFYDDNQDALVGERSNEERN